MENIEANGSLLLTSEAFLFLAGVTAPVALVLWYLFVRGRPLLPRQRHRSVLWNGWEICLAFFFCLLFWPTVIGIVAHFSFPSGAKDADLTLSDARRLLWLEIVCFPFQLASILIICFRPGSGRLHLIGLDGADSARRFAAGWLFWVCSAPLVLALNGCIDWLYSELLNKNPEKHPLEQVAELNLQGPDWFLVIAVAAIAVPFLEELLFRGALQAWATRRFYRGAIVMLISLVLVFVFRWRKLVDAAVDHDWSEAIPLLFVVLIILISMILSYVCARRRIKAEAVNGIFATSMLFAIAHAHVWPTPMPLFFLALCIGYLAYRTQSIIPGVVIHSLFNGIAVVTMMLSQWQTAS